ncbi:prepilin-type N-terminal cleavage/methylation domain-containing protein [Acinetobacter defluvii]|uniref:Prepilin-type N-terminal cleavage/methylation domain-containing protein n=1 Tax=Acinetobacter defluvii TaxID=1871111 RepID=A0A2S2FIK7_9GAMM|nr:prepilin-type N-terminal cleavage/methylation domain-containing protein [Acinetobacter defluvii]AWL30192.1 prepilin-type N-terminal cleavage/methylation domain-containing protein [Acinetobacter defluvii]
MRFVRGFTLIELMVTIAVLAVIAMMAAPSFGNLVARKQLDTLTQELVLLFGEARGQAISLRKNITIKLDCPKNDKQELVCSSNTATSFTWISKNPDIQLTSDPIDVVFSGLGSAKQRTKTIPNPNYDKDALTDLTKTPPINPKTIEEVVPLAFTLCNVELGENRTILIAQNGTVEGISKGACS